MKHPTLWPAGRQARTASRCAPATPRTWRAHCEELREFQPRDGNPGVLSLAEELFREISGDRHAEAVVLVGLYHQHDPKHEGGKLDQPVHGEA